MSASGSLVFGGGHVGLPLLQSGGVPLSDFGLGLAAFALLVFWKAPPWLVVVLSAAAGWGLQRILQ